MAARKLNYADITHLSGEEQQSLLKKMRAGHTVRTTRQEWKGSGKARRLVDVVGKKDYPALEALWLQKVGERVILFGYMRPEECPVPVLRDKPKGVRKPEPVNGGLVTEEEYRECRNW